MLTDKKIEKMKLKEAAQITDKEDAIKVVKLQPHLFKTMEIWHDDKDVAMAAIDRTAYSIEYISDRLKDDEEVVLLAMKQNPRLLMEASKRLTDSDEMRKIAFEMYGHPFIVDKQAWRVFERMDAKMMRDTTVEVKRNGRIEIEYDEEKMENNSFYRKMYRYYNRSEANPITAQDIRKYEKYLLDLLELKVINTAKKEIKK
ncbi:MAG: DUF4116 domain-containing protein [Candidatus Gastranaerophilales bacterium]|nr:DUF4116 domain-containing protein [Candidatus Gastranaerophilales bacterium]